MRRSAPAGLRGCTGPGRGAAVGVRGPAVRTSAGPARTPCGAGAPPPEPQLKKPLSDWTEAEQRLRLSQQKSLKMPGARGTLGLVVYVWDGVPPPLGFPAFLRRLFPPHPVPAPRLPGSRMASRTTIPRSLLFASQRVSPVDYSSQKRFEALPSLISRTTVPRDFGFAAVLLSLFPRGGRAPAGQGGAPRRRAPS